MNGTAGIETTIAIVGAGPVGLAAALVLADAGYRVALIAPANPVPDKRTSALLAGSVALLERIGVWRDLIAEAAPLRTMRIVDATRRLIRAPEVAFDAGEIGLPAFGYNLTNAALVAALERAVANRGITRIDALANDVAVADDKVVIALADGGTVTAKLVIGAAIFGIGWGLSGFCPGPSVANLGLVPWQVWPFVAAMFVGSWVAGQFMEFAPSPPAATTAA